MHQPPSPYDLWSVGMYPSLGKIISLLYPLVLYMAVPLDYNFENPEGRVIDRDPEDTYDFIVVGGGSTGAVVASRLSENPKFKVLLLEAGGDETFLSDVPMLSQYLQLSDMDWQYKTEPQENACLGFINRRCNWPRGKVLGGSSVLNYMLYVRGNRADYDSWAEAGNYGWDYESVLPYFQKSEDNQNPYIVKDGFHGTGGYLTVTETPWRSRLGLAFLAAGVEMGYDLVDANGATQTGFMIAQGTTRRGRRCSTAKAFLRPVRLRKNLHISLFTFVHKVLIDRNDKAFAIKYEKHGRIGHAFAKKEIILSAGTIGSPTILMHSGIGPKEHLEEFGIPVIRDLPVGRNLQDHIGVFGLNFLAKKGLAFKQDRYEKLSSILKYYLKGEGPLTSIGGVEALAFMHTKYSNDSNLPDVEFHFIPGSPAADGGRHLWRAQGLPFEVYEEFYEPLLDKDVWTCLPMLLRPKSVGVIKLRSSNVYEYPLIYPNYLTHPLDTATLVEALKMMILMSETKAFREVGTRIYARPFPGCENHDLFSDKYFECLVRHTTQTIYHPVGTAKMGPSWDPEAVVDPELRVYGIKSLRVADCSIMPTIVSGNTNAPTIMIGERASDLIKAKWGYVA